jgi:hypothetical protein
MQLRVSAMEGGVHDDNNANSGSSLYKSFRSYLFNLKII